MQKFPYVILEKQDFDQRPYPVVILIFFRYEFFSVCSVFGVRCAFIFNIRIRSIQNLIQQCFIFSCSLGEPVIFVTNSTCVTGVHYISSMIFHFVCINLTLLG